MLWCYANNAKALRPSGQALGCRRGPRWSLRAPSPESPAAAHIGQVVLDANQTRFAYLKVHNCIVAKYIVRSYIVHSYIVHSTSLEVTDAQCASVRIGPHTRTRTHTHPYAHICIYIYKSIMYIYVLLAAAPLSLLLRWVVAASCITFLIDGTASVSPPRPPSPPFRCIYSGMALVLYVWYLRSLTGLETGLAMMTILAMLAMRR